MEDAQVLLELAAEAHDAASAQEATDSLTGLEMDVARLELERRLSGEHDRSNCFMDIVADGRSPDATDWASRLARMYMRYCEAKGWKVEFYSAQDGEEAGFESLTMRLGGAFAYGYLKKEVGEHQLVRISPFDANAGPRTALASVEVYPDADDFVPIDIPEKDVELTFHRSGGHGGQQVNNLFSTARLRHLPTGILITCQTERSPSANKGLAFKLLRSRLFALELKKREAERVAVEVQQNDNPSGSRIRTYVLTPYRRIKDLRTGVETSNVDAVLDGELDPFITAQFLGVKNPHRDGTE